MTTSKSKIDKAGRILSEEDVELTLDTIELEYLFDEYRKTFLAPLTDLTGQIQGWLSSRGDRYYIAQRLKRKPQILRKLRRLSVRLTQLQDIGGCRIIVDRNSDVDELLSYLSGKIEGSSHLNLVRKTDYRPRGRDDTGYRALHLMIQNHNHVIELQIRSEVQHYWAESIERTSVIYGRHLKEKEGDPAIIGYFKTLSEIFYAIEAGGSPNAKAKRELDDLRERSEKIIEKTPGGRVLGAYINEGLINLLAEKERAADRGINNWIFVFDWSTGSFITWDIVSRDPQAAADTYVKYEKDFPESEHYEVVLIGSSDVGTVRRTHSHYFGIAAYDKVLESLQDTMIGFSKKLDLDVGAQQIISALARKKMWGSKRASEDTLRNHFCKNVLTFDESLKALKGKGFVLIAGGISLDISKKADIQNYIQQ